MAGSREAWPGSAPALSPLCHKYLVQKPQAFMAEVGGAPRADKV